MSVEKVFGVGARDVMAVMGRFTASPASSATTAIATALFRHYLGA